VIFKIPVPPSINAAYRNVSASERVRFIEKNGVRPLGRVKTVAYRSWLNEAGWRIRQQNVGQCVAYCGINISVPLKRNRDLDNIIKLILDLLVEMNVLIDDSQVDEIHVHRMPYAKDAEAEVKVYPLEAVDGQRLYGGIK
jgi:Holliday junction resolvase RusA-like endonuclease